MGDGRYYTFIQFYEVMVLTALVIFVILSAMSSYYRTTKYDGGGYITAALLQFLAVSLVRFAESVVASQSAAAIFRKIEAGIFISAVSTFLFFLYKITSGDRKEEMSRSRQRDRGTFLEYVFIVGCAYLILGREGAILKKYSFSSVEYSNSYAVFLAAGAVAFAAMAVRIFILKKHKKAEGLCIQRNKPAAILIFFMCAVPLSVYAWAATFNFFSQNAVELAVYLLFTLLLDIVAHSFVPHNITPIAFDSIKDIISQYVFVTDSEGRVLYKSANAEGSGIFKDGERLGLSDAKGIFIDGAQELSTAQGNIYVKIVKGFHNHYFSYRRKELTSGNKRIGLILTVAEVTEIIEMLEHLEAKKHRAQEINCELSDYSRIVYHLEKEKQINTLMEKIIGMQKVDMREIVSQIQIAAENLADEECKEYIERSIELANSNISRVREAVTVYREYYGG